MFRKEIDMSDYWVCWHGEDWQQNRELNWTRLDVLECHSILKAMKKHHNKF